MDEIEVARGAASDPITHVLESMCSDEASGVQVLSGDEFLLEEEVNGKSVVEVCFPSPRRGPECIESKSHFGPKRNRGREAFRTSPLRRDSPPSLPPDRTHVAYGRTRLVEATFIGGRSGGFPQSNRIWLDPTNDVGAQGQFCLNDDPQVILPYRPTLMNFSPSKGSPFGWFKGSAFADLRHPPPFSSVHARLGISKGEIESRLTSEIEEVLLQSAEDRRLARVLIEVMPDSLAPSSLLPAHPPSPPLIVLSKDDAIKLLSPCDFSTSGALLGVWCWAADLGRTGFNFNFDWDKDDLSILDAYD